MMRQTLVSASMVLAFGALALACEAGGVGDPCIPNAEFSPDYPGATESGAEIEDRSFQCDTRVCLVNHFRGRVTCPFGNNKGDRGPVSQSAYTGDDRDECYVPGTSQIVTEEVNSQCKPRKDEVYCSCRCAGDDDNAKYCECPDGYTCATVTNSLDPTLVAPGDKYCVKKGTLVPDGYECPQGQGCHEVPGGCGYTKNAYDF